jgi:hypothetical protein
MTTPRANIADTAVARTIRRLLLRVALSKLLTVYEFRKQGQKITSNTAALQTPMRLVREWMNRPSAQEAARHNPAL